MKTIQIVNGPSREELFDALRLSGEARQTNFTLKTKASQNEIKLPGQVSLIQAEDGSGESWNIELFFQDTKKIGDILPHTHSVSAYYSTKKRTGVIILK